MSPGWHTLRSQCLMHVVGPFVKGVGTPQGVHVLASRSGRIHGPDGHASAPTSTLTPDKGLRFCQAPTASTSRKNSMNEEDSQNETVEVSAETASVAPTPDVVQPAPPAERTKPGKPSFWETRYGCVLANGAKSAIARSLGEYGEWIEQELDTIGALLDEGHVVLEYGAEYGAQTLWLSQVVGPAGQVYVIEPRRFEHIALCSTLALNDIRNVYPLHAALGDSRNVSVFLPAADGHPEETSRQVGLDALRISKLSLIKINRAGGLLPMLAGAESTLRSLRPIVYFRLSNTDLATEEIKMLKSMGYRCWSHLPYLYNASNFASNTANIFPGWVSQNVIAAHKDVTEEFAHLHEL